jgi:hypothetical protein
VVKYKVLSLFAIALIAAGPAFAGPTGTDLSSRDRADLLEAAASVRAAILRGDAAAFLGFLSQKQGLVCTDTVYRYDKVAKYLSDKGSYLYLGLFDSEHFAAQCGKDYSPEYPAASDKAFFERSPNSAIEITFSANDYAEVTYASGAAKFYPRKYEFRKEPQGWKLVGGIIIGNCSCG